MNKLFMLIAGILLMGLVIGAGGILGSITTANIELTYPPIKDANNVFTKTDMLNFDGVTYEVKGNTIILNKKNVFQNREITFSTEQSCISYSKVICIKEAEAVCLEEEVRPEAVCLKYENPKDENSFCLDWEAPKGCVDFDKELGECIKWENELKCLKWEAPICLEYSTPTCIKYSNYDLNYFIKVAIQKEIEFVKGIQIQRANKVTTATDINGKVTIK